jgi:monoamine oxidase
MTRTPLAKALRLARLANRRDTPPANELVEMRRESALLGAQAPWTRRHFLKTSGAATLALAGGGLLASCAKMKPKGGAPRIAVIGAGLAGLNAAYTLKKLGHRAEVYEASKRMGGRIYTANDVMAPGLFAELGGEWLNEDHDEAISLVKEFGLELSDLRAPSERDLLSSYYFEGTIYTDAQLIEALQPVVALMEDDIDAIDTLWNAESDDDWKKAISLISPLDEISAEEYLDRIGATGWARTFLEVTSASNGGLDNDQQSALNIIGSVSLDSPESPVYFFEEGSERYKIVGGCQGIIRGLAERVEGQVKLAHRLEAVKSSGEGFTLTFEDPNGSALDVEADFVIMTVPFTMLRNVEMQMEMPAMKRKAIDEMGYGIHTKLLAGVDKRVWREKGYGGANTDEPFQAVYDNSQMAGYVGDAGGLTYYLGGQASIDVRAGTAEEQVERFMPVVEKLFPGVSAVLNGKTHRFDWGTYPYSLGGYPCYKPGQWTTIYNPGEPVGNMLFAGDHCSWDQGYINGAIESGMRAAKELATRLGKNASVPKET